LRDTEIERILRPNPQLTTTVLRRIAALAEFLCTNECSSCCYYLYDIRINDRYKHIIIHILSTTTYKTKGKSIPSNGLLVELGSRDCSCPTASSTNALADSRERYAAIRTAMGCTLKLNRIQKTAS